MMLQCDTRALGCSVDRVSAEIFVPDLSAALIVIATIAVHKSSPYDKASSIDCSTVNPCPAFHPASKAALAF